MFSKEDAGTVNEEDAIRKGGFETYGNNDETCKQKCKSEYGTGWKELILKQTSRA